MVDNRTDCPQALLLLCHQCLWCSYSRRHHTWNSSSVFSGVCQKKCRTWKNKDIESSSNTENPYIKKMLNEPWMENLIYSCSLCSSNRIQTLQLVVLCDLVYSLTYTYEQFISRDWMPECLFQPFHWPLCCVYCQAVNKEETLWMDEEYVTWRDPCEKRHTPWGRSSTTEPGCPSAVQTPPVTYKTA